MTKKKEPPDWREGLECCGTCPHCGVQVFVRPAERDPVTKLPAVVYLCSCRITALANMRSTEARPLQWPPPTVPPYLPPIYPPSEWTNPTPLPPFTLPGWKFPPGVTCQSHAATIEKASSAGDYAPPVGPIEPR